MNISSFFTHCTHTDPHLLNTPALIHPLTHPSTEIDLEKGSKDKNIQMKHTTPCSGYRPLI
jgi:hypothetical protein